jgi:drug/metabolite transporter (DMT)-like permease
VARILLSLSIAADGSGGVTDIDGHSAALIIVLGLVNGVVAHGLITWAQHRVPVGAISMLQLEPALGTVWAAALLHESVGSIQIIGIAIVLTAVTLIAHQAAQPVPYNDVHLCTIDEWQTFQSARPAQPSPTSLSA